MKFEHFWGRNSVKFAQVINLTLWSHLTRCQHLLRWSSSSITPYGNIYPHFIIRLDQQAIKVLIAEDRGAITPVSRDTHLLPNGLTSDDNEDVVNSADERQLTAPGNSHSNTRQLMRDKMSPLSLMVRCVTQSTSQFTAGKSPVWGVLSGWGDDLRVFMTRMR